MKSINHLTLNLKALCIKTHSYFLTVHLQSFTWSNGHFSHTFSAIFLEYAFVCCVVCCCVVFYMPHSTRLEMLLLTCPTAPVHRPCHAPPPFTAVACCFVITIMARTIYVLILHLLASTWLQQKVQNMTKSSIWKSGRRYSIQKMMMMVGQEEQKKKHRPCGLSPVWLPLIAMQLLLLSGSQDGNYVCRRLKSIKWSPPMVQKLLPLDHSLWAASEEI